MEPTGPQPGEKFAIIGDGLVVKTDSCNCAGQGLGYGHENYCGVEYVGPLEDLMQDPEWAAVIAELQQ